MEKYTAFIVPKEDELWEWITIARRIFGLCFLNVTSVASYVERLNPERKNDSPTSQDYTFLDYNYVCLRRKKQELLYQAITAYPGATLSLTTICSILETWRTQTAPTPLQSYTLEGERLIRKQDSKFEKRCLAFLDTCPRTTYPRLCISVHFLRCLLPDLMGKERVEDLLEVFREEKEATGKYTCIGCFKADRETILLPCNHVLLCQSCSTELKPQECLVCRKPVTDRQRIYLS